MKLIRAVKHNITSIIPELEKYNYFPAGTKDRWKFIVEDSRRYYVDESDNKKIVIISVNNNNEIIINALFNINKDEAYEIISYLLQGYRVLVDTAFLSNTLRPNDINEIINKILSSHSDGRYLDELIATLQKIT